MGNKKTGEERLGLERLSLAQLDIIIKECERGGNTELLERAEGARRLLFEIERASEAVAEKFVKEEAPGLAISPGRSCSSFVPNPGI